VKTALVVSSKIRDNAPLQINLKIQEKDQEMQDIKISLINFAEDAKD